ncbi:MAG: LacI family transcriptional regulator [Treponema sp.]|nr:LacI family transcriptional regulator [Treponema sp.]
MVQSSQVTIYDVAKKAGVSPATVSRVLNAPEKVAEKKRQLVLDVIKELNFVPKADAVINARKSYKKIAVIAPFFTQPSFMQRLRGVAEVLAPEHYELVVYSIGTAEDLNNYVTSLVVQKRVDGLILFCVQISEQLQEMLKTAGFPVCFVEQTYDDFDCIVIDNKKGGKTAAEYFFNKGCRNPGFIGEKSYLDYSVPATEDRLAGYKKYFASKGIEIKPQNIWLGDFAEDKLDESINAFLAQSDGLDCVFCSSDLIATRLFYLVRQKGIKCPEKLKILGFDDIDISQYVGLSSIDQHLEESGSQAAQQILERISNPEKSTISIKLPLHVVERNTTC